MLESSYDSDGLPAASNRRKAKGRNQAWIAHVPPVMIANQLAPMDRNSIESPCVAVPAVLHRPLVAVYVFPDAYVPIVPAVISAGDNLIMRPVDPAAFAVKATNRNTDPGGTSAMFGNVSTLSAAVTTNNDPT